MPRLPVYRGSVMMLARYLAFLVVTASAAGAQVVRGVVRDGLSGAPIPGVIVTLDEAVERLDTDAALRRASLVLAVLTNEKGEFAVRSPLAGRYVLSAKRVGLKRHQSAPFALAVGETRRMDLAMSAIDLVAVLQQVEVLTDAPCAVRSSESRRVAALWEEARAALTASRLALRDRLFSATVVRYARELQPQSLRVLREQHSTRRGVVERAFVSLASSELSSRGYVQEDPDGSITYYAPDAAVLTSDEFLRDHCFSVTAGREGNSGLVGLAFEPVASRSQAEIRGTMWMDSTSFELRRVEYRYVRLPRGVADAVAHGEVGFTSLENGWWYVSRWFIRMPEFGPGNSSGILAERRAPVLVRYKEEGGDVTADGVGSTARSATLFGRVLDSTGRAPLRDAVRVRLSGTPYEAPVGRDGAFRLDSLAAGSYTLIVEHPVYAALGMFAGEQDLEIAEASASATALNAPGTETIMGKLCGVREFQPDRAIVRVIALTASGAPLPDAMVRLHFQTFERSSANITSRPNRVEITTDRDGGATFCDVPARVPVRFELMGPDGRRVDEYKVLTPSPRSIVVLELRR